MSMRVLWVSDSPTTPSGFGTVTREVCSRLVARGHTLEILGWQTRGGTVRWQGIPVHPTRHDTFGGDVLLGYLHRFRPDFVVSLADVWWMSYVADPAIQSFLDAAGTRWVHYYPVDGATPDGVLPKGWAGVLHAADVPVAMSEYGREVSRRSGVDAAYVPHGVDTAVFAPPEDKHVAKRALGYEGAFVVLSDARNQPRKLLPRTVDIVRELVRLRDDVMVHLHCDPRDPAASSDLYRYRLLNDLEQARLLDRVRFSAGFEMRPDGGVAMSDLARLYAAADAHLLCSWGEGFGLPTLQAASAGVVPLAVDATASRELVTGHGVPLPAESTMLDEFGLERYLLSREAAVAGLLALHDDPALLAELGRRARAFALDYDWETVTDAWLRILAEAPPRRRSVRSRMYAFRTGERPTSASPVQAVVSQSLAELPEGASVQIAVTERRWGETAAAVLRDAFVHGDEISIPVRLPPALDGLPKAQVGWVMAGPGSLVVLAPIQQIFPSVQIAITTPDADPANPERLALDDLLPSLPRYALVADPAGDACPGIDIACAVLGTPYLGASPWWPPVPGAGDVARLRMLLTDQGLSQWRRQIARAAVEQAADPALIARVEALAGARAAGAEPAVPSSAAGAA
jgi:glycosyltransferase involved in cell wall biosynthesis